jgi:thiamine biosynthesis lipoprotein
MEDIDRRFNALNPLSPVYQFNKNSIPIADRDIVDLVRTALDVAERTDGAFDITVYPLVELWGFYAKAPAVPEAAQIAECLKRVGWRNLAIEDGKLVKRQNGTEIDLGGIAEGYAVTEAVRVLKEAGIRSALVDAGGDIYAFGHVRGRPWRVGVRNPRGDGIIGAVDISDGSVSTSGDYERFFEKDGIRYPHIFDPKTGYPPRGVISATVVSSNAALADAWALAVFVMGAQKGLERIRELPGAEALVVTADGTTHVTPGLKARLLAPQGGNGGKLGSGSL